MLPYLFILIFSYWFARQIEKQRKEDPRIANRKKWILIAVMTAFIGLRYSVGADYFAYIHDYYKYIALSWWQIFADKEPIIRLIAKICHLIYTPRYVPVLFFLSLAFVFISTSICSIYKYSSDFSLSIILFILCGSYLDSCNASRQCMAAGIFFANYENIRQQKLVKFLLLTILAYLFHNSAITLLPLYFVFAPNLPKGKQLIYLLCTGALLFISFDKMMDYTGTVLNKELADDVTYFHTSVNIFRVLVFLAPCALLLIRKVHLEQSLPPFAIFIIFNALMALATCRSAYLMRICIYTNVFLCLALPEALQNISLSADNERLLLVGMLLFYFIFWGYGILQSAGLYPYSSVLFN